MILLSILFGIILIVIIIFASPQLSPIPYFPSNRHDVPLIINALALKNNDVIFDLGAGDGIIIFEAARWALKKHLNTRFVAVEMNPILAGILYIRRLMHRNRKNITILCQDMFKVRYPNYMDDGSQATVYLYVSPRFIPKIVTAFNKQIRHFKLVSYFYPIETDSTPQSTGVHDVYVKRY